MSESKKTNKLLFILPVLALFSISVISWTNLNQRNLTENIHQEDTLKVNVIDAVVKPITLASHADDIYSKIGLQQTGLAFPIFEKALTGFINLKTERKLNNDKDILTVIDFSKSSTSKRMWIIDLKNNALLLNTYVAHGRGSGDDMATKFSNIAESHQSSLGFYVTNETYFGKHGLSLRLDGHDKGVNHLARNRAIVIHGASYVSQDFIAKHGRLGRSHGCPAVPTELNKTVIELIKNKTCLFINGESNNYQSVHLDTTKAQQNFYALANS